MTANINKFCKQAYEKLEMTVSNEQYHDIMSNSFKFENVELVSTNSKNNPPKNTFSALSPKNKAISRIFERVFSMWEAGDKKGKLFKEIYAFPPKDDKHDYLKGKNLFELDYDELAPVNLTPEHADYFLSCLVSQAKNISNVTSKISAANRSRFFLIGDVGTGKTTFLNYIFSKHYDILKKRKIMWIRIDLTKTYHGAQTLSESLEYQLARIVRKSYYDNYFENDPEFEDTIKKQFSTLVSQGKVTEKELSEYLMDYISPYESERTEPFNSLLQRGVQKYVHKRFSMIYIYDGLDRLRRGSDFEDKLEEIQKHILGSEKRKHLYIFVMRTTSHARSLNKYLTAEEHTLAALRKVSKTFTVLPPKLSEVVRRRLYILCSSWDRLLYEERHGIIISDINDLNLDEDVDFKELEKIMKSCKWLGDPELLHSYYKVFLRFIYRGLNLSDVDDSLTISNIELNAYRSLKNVVGSNFRILLSVLNHLQNCFLKVIESMGADEDSIINMSIMIDKHNGQWSNRNLRRILARHYLVIKTLLRELDSYVHPFIYSRGNDGKLVVNLDNKVPFIFNIYKGANISNKKGEKYHLLAKVRLLQYLQTDNPSERNKIIDLISSCFGYNKEYLSCDLNELMTMGLLSRKPRNNEYGDIYYEYYITRSGTHLLTKLMYEFSYLEIVLDDILVPKELVSKFVNMKDPNIKNNINERLKNMPRIVYFLLLICSIEKKEAKYFEINNRSSLTYDDTYPIYDKLSTSFLDTFQRMLSDKDQAVCNNALTILNNTFSQRIV